VLELAVHFGFVREERNFFSLYHQLLICKHDAYNYLYCGGGKPDDMDDIPG
jgi:hypothetical protein